MEEKGTGDQPAEAEEVKLEEGKEEPKEEKKESLTPLYSPLFWILDKENDLPSWYSLNNARLRSLPIPKPDNDIRRYIVESIVPRIEGYEAASEEQRKENIETLDSIALQIKEHPNCLITIEGYANNVTNTERENIRELVPLSQLRANAIMELLSERGITKDILTAKGKGGANPLAAWEDRPNWWKNRRVEFVVEKQE